MLFSWLWVLVYCNLQNITFSKKFCGLVLLKPYLSHYIDGTHQQLIQVSVHHDFRAVYQGVLETCPDLLPQLISYIQLDTQISQTDTS